MQAPQDSKIIEIAIFLHQTRLYSAPRIVSTVYRRVTLMLFMRVAVVFHLRRLPRGFLLRKDLPDRTLEGT
jgi:hypothetical protein